ncbi:peptidyl-prolyl cis-trans isomerase [Herbaspirillum chlorophenolicum]|jgi:peptidyl-prolyl cis-trans isomerase C|uniref:peptidylprolyl isomerase n=1 Tax=Herbaspirillum chlorophenolicum TaxID=211589 RepID=A0ABW8ETS5_9BURK|nr:peptidyl-prolyl cis-trans isomerase [Herbaspirillum chlorophenolicum]
MTFKPARLLVLLFAIASIPALAQNLAVVNGKAIPSSRADLMVKQMTSQGQPDSPQLRGAIKEELINREILMQEADKQGLSSSQDVKNQLELARQSIVIRALIADYLKKNPVSDADIKAEYDKFKAQAGDKEYHARHILVDKEEDAKAIIAKLKAGTKFEDLAKQSKDTGSAANGGDLDWATPASFVKPFSDAMVALKKGEVTQTPVQTQFGWHVIQLEDVRPAKVPTLDEVKPQIAEALQQKKLQAYQEELRKKAKVQ